MSEHTKGELEYRIFTANSIEIISKEDESVVIAYVDSEEDDLGGEHFANAKHLVKCWNCHDELAAACKKAIKDLSMRISNPDDRAWEIVEELQAILDKAKSNKDNK